MELLLATVVMISFLQSAYGSAYSLNKLSTLYVPSYHESTGQPYYKYDTMTSDQMAYDSQDKIMYLIGDSLFHVIDVSDPEKMKILHHTVFSNSFLTDIEYCGGYLFLTSDNHTDTYSRLHGDVIVLNKYKPGNPDSLKELKKIEVGSAPEALRLSKDCRTVVVTIGGSAFGTGSNFQDPLGGVTIIKFPDGVEKPTIRTTNLDFTEYDYKVLKLEKDGVRFIYRANGNTFDRDAQPETVVVNDDATRAYVCLQTNNAIAEVNIETEEITALRGLGYKSWKSFKMDASDRDSGINLQSYDIRSFYQPDAIHYTTWRGKNIIITTDEGMTKDYENLIDWNEKIRGKDLVGKLSSRVPQEIKSALADDSKLGRLVFSRYDGLNSDGDYDHLYTYGGRGITIRLASDMSILYDSGDILEQQHAKHFPRFFNAAGLSDSTPRETMDTMSASRGTECESVESAVISGRLVIFIGCETPGAISVFSVGDDFNDVRYESTFINIPRNDITFSEMLDQRIISGIDPEDIRYIEASDSPIEKSLLFVASSETGTLSVFNINVVNCGARKIPGLVYSVVSAALSTVLLFKINIL